MDLKIHIAGRCKNKKILLMKVTADQHIHDSKALLELIENIIKLNSMTTAIGKLFADDAHEGNEVLDIHKTMESCHALK